MGDVLWLCVAYLTHSKLLHVALYLLLKAFEFLVLGHELFFFRLEHRYHIKADLGCLLLAKLYLPRGTFSRSRIFGFFLRTDHAIEGAHLGPKYRLKLSHRQDWKLTLLCI